MDLIFPPRCSGCDRVDYTWCDDCRIKLDRTPVTPQFRSGEQLAGIVATGIHTGIVQAAIHGLKYENVQALAEYLAPRLAVCLAMTNWPIDVLVPVPLHADRLARRGYNQCQLLAEHLARHVSAPCEPSALKRERDTRSQVGLSAQERQTNVAAAFQANPALVEGRRLLLIDDVCTTGATLTSCAQAALSAGAKGVYALTLTTPDTFTRDDLPFFPTQKERMQWT